MFYEWCAMSHRPGIIRHQLVAAGLLAVAMIAVVLQYSAASILILIALSVLATLLGARLSGQGHVGAGRPCLCRSVRSVAGIPARRRSCRAGRDPVSLRRRVGHRHLRLFRRALAGRTEAGARDIARQDPERRAWRRRLAGFSRASSLPPSPVSAICRCWRWSRFLLSVISQIGDLFEILGQAPAWREGFGQSHTRPWRRDGSRRRACRGGLCPLRRRRVARRRRQPRASFVCELTGCATATDLPHWGDTSRRLHGQRPDCSRGPFERDAFQPVRHRQPADRHDRAVPVRADHRGLRP